MVFVYTGEREKPLQDKSNSYLHRLLKAYLKIIACMIVKTLAAYRAEVCYGG